MTRFRITASLCILGSIALAQGQRAPQAVPSERPGALSRANIFKADQKKPPFDLTGTWQFGIRAGSTKSADYNRSTGGFEFFPLPKLTAAAQAEWDAKEQASKDGKAYKDDTGACYPPGMPRFMTRVWPFQIMQYPSVIIMIVGLTDRVRWIYLDGRPHTDPEITELTFNGDSLGHWEGDTLVVDTVNFETAHHWMQAGIPLSEKLHIVERIRMLDSTTFEIQSTFADPDNWAGQWKTTKRYDLAENRDITENHCLPDTNKFIPGAQPSAVVR